MFYLATNLEHKSKSQMNSTNIIINGTGFQYIMEGKNIWNEIWKKKLACLNYLSNVNKSGESTIVGPIVNSYTLQNINCSQNN